MHRLSRGGLVPALAAAAVAVTPSAALAQRGPGDHARAGAGGAAPARVADRLRRALKAVDRADERIDDGDAAKAVAQLRAARRALAAAQRSTLKVVAANGAKGPGAVRAVLAADAQIVTATADAFDEQDGDVVTALAATGKAALDSQDALVAAVSRLGADDQADYDRAFGRFDDALADEADAIDGALADDTLTSDAQAALNAAKAQVAATTTAAASLTDASAADRATDDGTEDEGADDGPGDCPPGGPRGGDGGPRGGDRPGGPQGA